MQQMIGKMARMYPMLIALGFMIVAVALVVGAANAQTAEFYFGHSKLVRETSLMLQRAALESTGLWLPYFKFLGIGLLLGGIVMALRVIIDNLKAVGAEVLSSLPEGELPAPPWFAALMPALMMLGLVILIVALVISLGLAGTARQVFAHPLPEIDAAGAGSAMLAQLQTIQASSAWLVPLKFLGVATEFLAIVTGLATILFALGAQTELLGQVLRIGRGKNVSPAAAADQRLVGKARA